MPLTLGSRVWIFDLGNDNGVSVVVAVGPLLDASVGELVRQRWLVNDESLDLKVGKQLWLLLLREVGRAGAHAPGWKTVLSSSNSIQPLARRNEQN